MLRVEHLQPPGLQPVSFTLDAGQCLAVRGRSGSGKSLLLRAIADLDPHDGDCWLDGRACQHTPAPQWRQQVRYLPAESGWWSDRVGDHFIDWAAVEPLLKPLGLGGDVHDWPVARLSTGERQRLALVRALNPAPRILLLDEPTSGLDEQAVMAVEQLIARQRDNGIGVLWVTHDDRQARRVASQALTVDAGQVSLVTL